MADSIREALTAAFDKSDEAETPDTDTVSTPDPVEQTTDDSDAGGTTSGTTTDTGGGEPAPDQEGGEPAPGQGGTTPGPTDAGRAPASWTAEEQAGWASVPPAARAAIARREKQINEALKTSVDARRRAQVWDREAENYRPLLDSYGVTLEQVVPNLLATRAALEVGTPQQKALLVANIIADFGVDVRVLDEALMARFSNGVPTPRYTGAQPEARDYRSDPQFAPLFALADQVREGQMARAQEEVNRVSSQPHFDEVRYTMADLIDSAKEHGRTLDVTTAYNTALTLHGLQGAAQTPAGGMSVSDAARTLAASRRAASSVSGAPKPSPGRKPGEGSLRDELEANFAARR